MEARSGGRAPRWLRSQRAARRADSPHIHRLTLAPGMGILCNNVLHDRTGFVDDPARPRLLYRARYHERIAGT